MVLVPYGGPSALEQVIQSRQYNSLLSVDFDNGTQIPLKEHYI